MKYNYKGVETDITIDISKKDGQKYDIRWENEYHELDDSLFCVSKSLDGALVTVYDEIDKQIDRAFDMILTRKVFAYRNTYTRLYVTEYTDESYIHIELKNEFFDRVTVSGYLKMLVPEGSKRKPTTREEVMKEAENMAMIRIDEYLRNARK